MGKLEFSAADRVWGECPRPRNFSQWHINKVGRCAHPHIRRKRECVGHPAPSLSQPIRLARLHCRRSELLPDYRVRRLLAIVFFAQIVFAQIVVLASLDP